DVTAVPQQVEQAVDEEGEQQRAGGPVRHVVRRGARDHEGRPGGRDRPWNDSSTRRSAAGPAAEATSAPAAVARWRISEATSSACRSSPLEYPVRASTRFTMSGARWGSRAREPPSAVIRWWSHIR